MTIKSSFAVSVAGICTVVFITLITVLADLVPALKDWLKSAFTHHWIGKGVLAAGLFALFYLLVYGSAKPEKADHLLAPLLRALVWLTILGTAILFLFFIWEAYWK